MYHFTIDRQRLEIRQAVAAWMEWGLTLAICLLIVLVAGGSLAAQLAIMVFAPSLGR